MVNKTIEERIADLEAARRSDDRIIKTAGGKLANMPPNASLEEIRKILQEIGRNLLSLGKGG